MGDDRYYINDHAAAVVENPGEGRDEVWTLLASYTLGANLEYLRGYAHTGQALTGNADANRIIAGDGNDRLDGGGGADEMLGWWGNDVYIVDNVGDQVLEYNLPGTDEIQTSLSSYALIALPYVENLTGTSATGQTLTGNGRDNLITGGGGNDELVGGDGNDLLVGMTGADVLRGGVGNDIYSVDAGDTVVELAGEGIDEIRTVAGLFVLPGGVENLRAVNDVGHDFRGNAANNVVSGGAGNDIIRIQDGGDDYAAGGDGVDSIYAGAAFTAWDHINGGANRDSLLLQGDYSAGIRFGIDRVSSLTDIEGISLVSGTNTSFGDTAGNLYDYKLTLIDSNVAAGALMKINGFTLQAGEDFTINASDERDAGLQIFAGLGADDLTGGQQNDNFVFGQEGRFAAGDKVDGQAGYDAVFLRGDYVIDFNAPGFAGSLVNVESIGLLTSANNEFVGGGDGDFDYSIIWNGAMLAAGASLTVNGSRLQSHETFVFNGAGETDGNLRIWGGAGTDSLATGGGNDLLYGGGAADQLKGGSGADTFRYQTTGESTASAYDTILDFQSGTDKIDLSRIDAKTRVDGDQAFAFIGNAAFTAAGQLRAFNVSGDLWQIEGDVDGDGVADLVIQLHVTGQPLTPGDFLP